MNMNEWYGYKQIDLNTVRPKQLYGVENAFVTPEGVLWVGRRVGARRRRIDLFTKIEMNIHSEQITETRNRILKIAQLVLLPSAETRSYQLIETGDSSYVVVMDYNDRVNPDMRRIIIGLSSDGDEAGILNGMGFSTQIYGMVGRSKGADDGGIVADELQVGEVRYPAWKVKQLYRKVRFDGSGMTVIVSAAKESSDADSRRS
jgi:hypothetical protein